MGDCFKTIRLHLVKPIEEPVSFKEKEKKIFITFLEAYYLVGENIKKKSKEKNLEAKNRNMLKATFKLFLKQSNKNCCEHTL